MKTLFRLLALVCLSLATVPAFCQANLSGTLYAYQFAQWSVSQGDVGQFSWSSVNGCTVTTGGLTFVPFTAGSPIRIVDTGNPANSETVTVNAVYIYGSSCSISVSPVNQHKTFYLTSSTGGLQEAINWGILKQIPAVVLVTPQFTGTTGTITSAKGNTNVSILDQRNAVAQPYTWNGSAYAASPGAGGPPTGAAGGDLSGTYPNPAVAQLKGVPFCTGYTPTNGQAVTLTTASSPNPCYTAVAASNSVITLYPQQCSMAGAPSWCSGTDPAAWINAANTYLLANGGGYIDASAFLPNPSTLKFQSPVHIGGYVAAAPVAVTLILPAVQVGGTYTGWDWAALNTPTDCALKLYNMSTIRSANPDWTTGDPPLRLTVDAGYNLGAVFCTDNQEFQNGFYGKASGFYVDLTTSGTLNDLDPSLESGGQTVIASSVIRAGTDHSYYNFMTYDGAGYASLAAYNICCGAKVSVVANHLDTTAGHTSIIGRSKIGTFGATFDLSSDRPGAGYRGVMIYGSTYTTANTFYNTYIENGTDLTAPYIENQGFGTTFVGTQCNFFDVSFSSSWAASTTYATNAYLWVLGYMWQATTGGTSGGSTPAWPATPTLGVTAVTDGGVTWTAEYKMPPCIQNDSGDLATITAMGTTSRYTLTPVVDLANPGPTPTVSFTAFYSALPFYSSYGTGPGPLTAPSGSCPTNGQWVFSQDAKITNCFSGTWTGGPPLLLNSLSPLLLKLVNSGTTGTSSAFLDQLPAFAASHTLISAELNLVTAPSGCATYPILSIYDSTASTILASAQTASGTSHYAMTINSATIPSGDVIGLEGTTLASGCGTNAGGVSINGFYF